MWFAKRFNSGVDVVAQTEFFHIIGMGNIKMLANDILA